MNDAAAQDESRASRAEYAEARVAIKRLVPALEKSVNSA